MTFIQMYANINLFYYQNLKSFSFIKYIQNLLKCINLLQRNALKANPKRE